MGLTHENCYEKTVTSVSLCLFATAFLKTICLFFSLPFFALFFPLFTFVSNGFYLEFDCDVCQIVLLAMLKYHHFIMGIDT